MRCLLGEFSVVYQPRFIIRTQTFSGFVSRTDPSIRTQPSICYYVAMRVRTMKRTTMAGSLYRMIYCSHNVIAKTVPGASEPGGMEREIRAIVAIAVQRNTADSVTGALLFTASGFAQVLEGPRDVVERTFERISLDPRHSDVAALGFTPTDRRRFRDWPMGFCNRTSLEEVDPLANLLGDTSFAGPRITTGGDILRLLESVVQREGDWIRA
jgi:hypothetical protein